MARRIFLLALIVAWLTTNWLWGAQWHFQPLGNLGGNDGFGKTSQALGISGDGNFVVGDSLATAGLGITTGTEALLWSATDARTRGIGVMPAKNAYSSARGVSLQGRVIVGECETEDGKRAFRWSQELGIKPLGVLPGHDESVAWDVSGDGTVIVGESSSFDEELAFRWTEGKMVELGDLPGGDKESTALAISRDGTTVVGHSSSKNGIEAFAWIAGDMTGLGSLKGKRFVSRAFAVSANGHIIVGDSLSERGPEAFRWTKETGLQPLGDLPAGAFQSKATGVAADGKVIVGTATGANGSEAFVWTPDSKMQPLGGVLQQKGLAKEWRLQEACGVASNGHVIVGWGKNPSGETAGWIAEYR